MIDQQIQTFPYLVLSFSYFVKIDGVVLSFKDPVLILTHVSPAPHTLLVCSLRHDFIMYGLDWNSIFSSGWL